MSSIKDFFPPAAQGFERSPMLHVQEQQPTGTNWGTMVTGDNQYKINQVVTNEITGASIGTNVFTLPAGKYYIEASGSVNRATQPKVELRKADDTVVLVGINQGTYGAMSSAKGVVEVDSTTDFKVVCRIDSVTPSVTSSPLASTSAPYEVYADVIVYKLDSIKKNLIVHDNNLYPLPGNAYVTGNISGLEYSMNSGSPTDTIDITAGICYDSLNTTVLTLAADTTATLSAPAINTIYNIFLTDAGDIQFDTDVDGATLLAGAVSQLRWLGFVRTDASGNIIVFDMDGIDLFFPDLNSGSMDYASPNIPTTYTQLDVSSFVPLSRCSEITTGPNSGAENGLILFSRDGVNPYTRLSSATTSDGMINSAPVRIFNGYYYKATATTNDATSLSVYGVTLKR